MAQKKKSVKKSAKASVKKAAVKAAPASMSAECACGKRGVCWKKIIVFVLGVAIGAGACMLWCRCCCKKRMARFGGPNQEMFVNGCVDFSKVGNPERAEKIRLMDANGDGCVSREELMSGDRLAPAPRPKRARRLVANPQ